MSVFATTLNELLQEFRCSTCSQVVCGLIENGITDNRSLCEEMQTNEGASSEEMKTRIGGLKEEVSRLEEK